MCQILCSCLLPVSKFPFCTFLTSPCLPPWSRPASPIHTDSGAVNSERSLCSHSGSQQSILNIMLICKSDHVTLLLKPYQKSSVVFGVKSWVLIFTHMVFCSNVSALPVTSFSIGLLAVPQHISLSPCIKGWNFCLVCSLSYPWVLLSLPLERYKLPPSQWELCCISSH